jgi:hypothetical protein
MCGGRRIGKPVWRRLAGLAFAAQLLAGASTVQAQAVPAPAAAPAAQAVYERWSAERAQAWYARQPWIVGANYTTSTAINELEMFQAATFDPATIDRELGWAERSFGMNTMRVFLHDLLWAQDPEGFKRRLDTFLAIASRHGIRPVLVLFDSCWDPDPVLGPQHRPIPGVHNSGWVQSPGRYDLVDRRNDGRFRAYVQGVVGAFAKDPRVLAWDVWNEPNNSGGGSYNGEQLPAEAGRITELLPQVFAWARAEQPIQPLTSGVWDGSDWSAGAAGLTEIQRIQLSQSDVISFHNYDWPEGFEARVRQLRSYGRPLICTEWMARGNGSTVDTVLPIGRRENVGMINWGLVDGKTQTRLPWDSWERPYTLEQPPIWFHELFRADGTPYRQREAEIFKQLEQAGRPPGAAPGQR